MTADHRREPWVRADLRICRGHGCVDDLVERCALEASWALLLADRSMPTDGARP